MPRGYFFSFEGVDGSGKSTQIQLLAGYLQSQGHEVIITREPGGTPIGEKIREILLDPDNKGMHDITEIALYAAARAQHVADVIKPAKDAGKIVLCDRFVHSSIAYQGYGRHRLAATKEINNHAVLGYMPDMVFYLQLSLEQITQRIMGRELDRLEQESQEFFTDVTCGYDEIWADYHNIYKFNAQRPPLDISRDIIGYVEGYIESHKGEI